MRSIQGAVVVALVSAGLLVASMGAAEAQVKLPSKSQLAKVSMVVGVTEIGVVYSSPAKRGRKIWGGLVPSNKIWRTGANAATEITFSTDVTFGDAKVKAGTYSLFTVPDRKMWTVILNSKTGMSGTQYDAAANVAKITIKPNNRVEDRERMTFLFSDSTDTSVNLDLEWAGVRARVPITIDTKALAAANIEEALGGAWRPHYQAGRYMLEDQNDPAKAIEYLNTSIAIQPTWWANWFKALALEKQKKTAEALASAKEAARLGEGDRVYENFFKKQITASIAKWSK